MPENLWGRLTTGGIIVLIGLLLLLSTTGVLEFRSVWEWIPLLFVLLGVWALLASEFRNIVGPIMIIAIAGTFLLRNLDFISDSAIGTWWPLFVVLFGVLIVINRSRRRQRVRLEGRTGATEASAFAVFGTDERRPNTDQFGGGELFSIFGDAIIDLRNVEIPAPPAVVETVSIFGDAEIRVPNDWEVQLDTMNIFGDTTDRRPADKSRRESNQRLIVTGVSIFGDISIRD